MPFSVHTYSSALYTFDYDYLFTWLGNDQYGYEPTLGENTVYLVIPDSSDAVQEDFIHYKTPDKQFTTEDSWTILNGTTVVKRMRMDR